MILPELSNLLQLLLSENYYKLNRAESVTEFNTLSSLLVFLWISILVYSSAHLVYSVPSAFSNLLPIHNIPRKQIT